jgi:muramoyltetrapeptide carboxypeptidase
MNRGKRLEKNDTIGIVAPASFAAAEKTAKAVEVLEQMGYRIKLGESCNNRWYSFSGNDQRRAADINQFFQDPAIDAILCLRGGYGSIRILNRIDCDLAKRNPKIFIGFSDITALHLLLNQRAHLITFHGPMLAANMAYDFDTETQTSFEKAVCLGDKPYVINNPGHEPLITLRGGKAEGILTGGNLQTLVSIIGTPYEPDLEGKLLFIEEVHEATYRIDRALSQLILSGKLNQAQGIILGDFKDCNPDSPEDMPLMEVFTDRLGDLGIPVIYNLRSGHCKPKLTLPLGALARIDGDTPQIEILEKVVA